MVRADRAVRSRLVKQEAHLQGPDEHRPVLAQCREPLHRLVRGGEGLAVAHPPQQGERLVQTGVWIPAGGIEQWQRAHHLETER